MGLAAIAAHKLGGFLPVGAIFKASIAIGQWRVRSRSASVMQTGFSTIPKVVPAGGPSQLTSIKSTETFSHVPLETLPVLQTNGKACVSE
jgi:hypothetical protein